MLLYVFENWLNKNGFDHDGLYMRPSNDMRGDDIIKREIYDNKFKNSYNVLGVFDDRNRVVKVWRDLGLKCFQVEEGDF